MEVLIFNQSGLLILGLQINLGLNKVNNNVILSGFFFMNIELDVINVVMWKKILKIAAEQILLKK